MTFSQLPEDGVLINVPRRIGWAAIIGGVMFFGGQIYFYAKSEANIYADITTLQRADVEARTRGDEIRRRLADLERNNDRITRVEEQLKITLEMLREIREEIRKR